MGVFPLLKAADIGSDNAQSLNGFRLVGLMRIDDEAEAIVEQVDAGQRYRVRKNSLLDDYRVRRVIARDKETYVELERAGEVYQIHMHGCASVEASQQFRLGQLMGDIDENGQLTDKGRRRIERNLDHLIAAAYEKMTLDNVQKVTFQDLVADYQNPDLRSANGGYDPFASPNSNARDYLSMAFDQLSIIAGEDYSGLELDQKTGALWVETRYGEVVNYEFTSYWRSQRVMCGGCF
ncbi:hypothetical protein [Cerasicoccus frondis]|uniref:hypothetical protein n=1 Tax=Cerasicoccus frondis TaxID=490090 RepID=UPI00285269DE|nr:hypothetical protein [Cerasicoccus frondis]